MRLVLVGTAYMDSATMPSNGRLLVFKLHIKECRLELLKSIDMQGSVQAICSLRENHQFLTIGQNNKVSLYSFQVCTTDVSLVRLDTKVCGCYVQCIQTSKDQIIVGDVLKGVVVLDLKESRHSKFTMVEGPSSG